MTIGGQGLKDLIDRYEKEAQNLANLAERLKALLESEHDTDRRKLLMKRIRLCETERFEVLRDINDMRKGM